MSFKLRFNSRDPKSSSVSIANRRKQRRSKDTFLREIFHPSRLNYIMMGLGVMFCIYIFLTKGNGSLDPSNKDSEQAVKPLEETVFNNYDTNFIVQQNCRLASQSLANFSLQDNPNCHSAKDRPDPKRMNWQNYLNAYPVPTLGENPLILYADSECLNDPNVIVHFNERYKCFTNMKTRLRDEAETLWLTNKYPSAWLNISPQDNMQPSLRIIGGTSASNEKSLGYVCSMKRLNNRHCTASIISKTLVLTVAHCIVDMMRNVRTDGSYVSTDATSLGITIEAGSKRWSAMPQVRRVKRVHWHPLYSSDKLIQDICIVQVDSPFEFNDSVYPIQLPKPDHDPVSKTSIIAGYGISGQTVSPNGNVVNTFVDDLQFISGQVRFFRQNGEPNECEKQSLTETLPSVSRYRSVFCFAPSSVSSTTCQGDSGSPVIQQNELGHDVVVGLVSYGLRLCGKGTGTGVTNVISHLAWIHHTVNRLDHQN